MLRLSSDRKSVNRVHSRRKLYNKKGYMTSLQHAVIMAHLHIKAWLAIDHLLSFIQSTRRGHNVQLENSLSIIDAHLLRHLITLLTLLILLSNLPDSRVLALAISLRFPRFVTQALQHKHRLST